MLCVKSASGLQASGCHRKSSELFLVRSPFSYSLDLLHRQRGKDQVGIIGEKGEGFGFVQCETKKVFLAAKGFAKLINQILLRLLNFSEELAAVVGAEGGERILVVFEMIGFHMYVSFIVGKLVKYRFKKSH